MTPERKKEMVDALTYSRGLNLANDAECIVFLASQCFNYREIREHLDAARAVAVRRYLEGKKSARIAGAVAALMAALDAVPATAATERFVATQEGVVAAMMIGAAVGGVIVAVLLVIAWRWEHRR